MAHVSSFLALVVAIVVLPGCGLTRCLWDSATYGPARLVKASLSSEEELRMAITYSDGQTWLVRVDLAGMRGKGYTRVTGYRDQHFSGTLPPSAVRTRFGQSFPAPANTLELGLSEYTNIRNAKEGHVRAEGAGYNVLVDVDRYADWWSPAPYLACAATPFTLAVDIVTTPIHVLWIFSTGGGHGTPWLPWYSLR